MDRQVGESVEGKGTEEESRKPVRDDPLPLSLISIINWSPYYLPWSDTFIVIQLYSDLDC